MTMAPINAQHASSASYSTAPRPTVLAGKGAVAGRSRIPVETVAGSGEAHIDSAHLQSKDEHCSGNNLDHNEISIRSLSVERGYLRSQKKSD
jgi:hypothetical protein